MSTKQKILYNKFLDEWSEEWFKIILNNPDEYWNWNFISQNPNITWNIIQANLDKPWNWDRLSENPNITWEIVRDNPDKPWVWAYLSKFLNPKNSGIKARIFISGKILIQVSFFSKNIDRIIQKRIYCR